MAEKCWADYKSRYLKDALKIASDDCRQAAEIFNGWEDALVQARTLTREAPIISDRDNMGPDFSRTVDLQKRAIEIAQSEVPYVMRRAVARTWRMI